MHCNYIECKCILPFGQIEADIISSLYFGKWKDLLKTHGVFLLFLMEPINLNHIQPAWGVRELELREGSIH
jgi:hypothetical protein